MTGWLAGTLVIGLLSAGLLGVQLGVRRRWLVVRVRGVSMLPTLRDGELILARRCGGRTLARGDIAVCHSPRLIPGPGAGWLVSVSGQPPSRRLAQLRRSTELIIKRVAALPGDPIPPAVAAAVPGVLTVPAGTVIVLSDNEGVDSRIFGPLPFDRVLGVAVRQLASRP